jgi:uncharacterized protein (DUF305 family)
MSNPSPHHGAPRNHHAYRRLGLMALLSFVAMYALMYAMVDSLGNVYNNWNQVYMAGLMTAPMVMLELGLMGSMYESRKLNAVILAASCGLLVLCWICIRQQTGISDRQFLKSMIPHHASALLMCEQGAMKDPEVRALCESIVSGQRAEIAQMKAKLEALQD